MPAGPNAEEIMKAIHESGYLMEQEVATQLEKRGLHVRTNVAFEDQEEGKSREIDVTAVKEVAINEVSSMAAYIELIVECKNSSNPFVFIARPKNISDSYTQPGEFIFPHDYESRENTDDGRTLIYRTAAFNHLGFDEVYTEHIATWKAVQFCRVDRKGKDWQANHGGLYDAIFYPMAKAIMARKKEVPQWRNGTGDWRYIWLMFPIIVTSGELFLIDSSEEQPSPSPVDYVTFQRELKSGKLSGTFMVTFVRQSAIEAFMANVVDTMADHARDIIHNKPDFFMTKDVPFTK